MYYSLFHRSVKRLLKKLRTGSGRIVGLIVAARSTFFAEIILYCDKYQSFQLALVPLNKNIKLQQSNISDVNKVTYQRYQRAYT